MGTFWQAIDRFFGINPIDHTQGECPSSEYAENDDEAHGDAFRIVPVTDNSRSLLRYEVEHRVDGKWVTLCWDGNAGMMDPSPWRFHTIDEAKRGMMREIANYKDCQQEKLRLDKTLAAHLAQKPILFDPNTGIVQT